MVPIAEACVVDRFSVLAAVSLLVTELAIVISRPSRIHAVPSPSTSRVWNGDQRSLSSRAGIVVRIGCCCLVATVVMPCASVLACYDPAMVLSARHHLWNGISRQRDRCRFAAHRPLELGL